MRSDANGYISARSGRHRSNSGFTLPHWPLPQLPQPMFPSVVPSLTTIVDRVDHCEMRLPASATRLRGGVRGIQIDKEYREFSQIIQSEQLLVLCIIQYFIVLCIYCVLRIVPPCNVEEIGAKCLPTVVHEAYCSPVLFTRPTVQLLFMGTITTRVCDLTSDWC